MIRIGVQICRQEGCLKASSYGQPGKKPSRCASHKLLGMVSRQQRCQVEGCPKQPTFNFEGSNQGISCLDHKEEGMVRVRGKRCLFPDCQVQPTFNIPGKKKGAYCGTHKEEGMLNVVSRVCLHLGCKKQPHFGPEGSVRGSYCSSHKPEGYVAVGLKICEHAGCSTKPSFGMPNDPPRWCKVHREDGAVNRSCACVFENCSRQPTFNLPGSPKAIYCSLHKREGDVNVKTKKCRARGCTKVPVYNLPGEKRGARCKTHMEEGMVNVKRKRCELCPTSAWYGPLFGKPTRCAKHKTPGMYPSSKRYPKCLHAPTLASKKCPNAPYYAPPGSAYPERCEDHALEDDVNVIEQECSRCHLTYLIPEGEDLCQGCKDYDSPKIVHAKELRVAKVLEAAGIETSQADAPVEWGCSKKRPDFIIDAPLGFVIVLEVDENQHHSYARECEMARMGQISQDLGGLPVIFVRYNPDAYTDHLGARVRGGTQNPGREAHLLDFLRRLLRKKLLPPPVSLYHLFYDRYDHHLGPQGVELDFYEFTVEELARVVYYPEAEGEGEEGEVEESATEDEDS